MLKRIFELFSPDEGPPPQTDEERLRLAACVLLLEVAGADDVFSKRESDRVVRALHRRFALSEEDAQELMTVARERRSKTFDLWQYTNPINESCSTAEKIAIIEEIWRVIYADGRLDGHEDYLVHKLARLMNLNHQQLISAKLKVRGEAGSA